MYAEGWLRGRWVECFLVIFLVVEVLTSPNGGAFFWPQQYPRLVSSLSTSFALASSSSRWVQGLRGRWLASPLSLWLRYVRPFFISLLLVDEDCICQGVFLISRFLLILAGVLWVSSGITLGWRRYCDLFFSCPLVSACGDSASVRGPSGFGRVLGVFSLFTLVILDPSEESSHGLWSLYLPRSVLWLLYIRTLSLPLLVQKAARHGGCCAWLSLNGFVLVLVSNDITSFQPLRQLGFALDVLQRPQVFVSPGVFFSWHSRLSFEWSWFSCLVIRDLCFVLFLTLRCFPGSRPLGCSCQPEHLHRHPLAIAIAVAFHLQWCSHLTFVILVRSYVSFLPWRLLPRMVDQFLLQSFLWCFSFWLVHI